MLACRVLRVLDVDWMGYHTPSLGPCCPVMSSVRLPGNIVCCLGSFGCRLLEQLKEGVPSADHPVLGGPAGAGGRLRATDTAGAADAQRVSWPHLHPSQFCGTGGGGVGGEGRAEGRALSGPAQAHPGPVPDASGPSAQPWGQRTWGGGAEAERLPQGTPHSGGDPPAGRLRMVLIQALSVTLGDLGPSKGGPHPQPLTLQEASVPSGALVTF